MKKVAIVTGASSGIALAAAKLLLKQGYYVVGGARHVEQMKVLTELGGKVHELDVTKESSLKAFVAFVLDSYGRVDVVVVEPGNTATGWQKIAVDKLLAATPSYSPYRRVAERLAKTLKDSRATTSDVAAVIVKAAMTRKPKLHYQIRFQEQVTAKLLKLIPDRIQDRLVTRMFS